jgi:hypothetical protein
MYHNMKQRGDSNIAQRLQLFNDRHLHPAEPGSFVFVKTPEYLLRGKKTKKRAVHEKWIFVARLGQQDARDRWTANWVTVLHGLPHIDHT